MFRRMRRRKREPWRVAEECGEMVGPVSTHGPKRVSFGACPYFFPRRGYPHALGGSRGRRGRSSTATGFHPRSKWRRTLSTPGGSSLSPPRFFFPHLSLLLPTPLDRPLSTDLDGDDGGKTDPRRDTNTARGSFLSMGHVSGPRSKGGCQGTLPPSRMRVRCYRLERSRNPLPPTPLRCPTRNPTGWHSRGPRETRSGTSVESPSLSPQRSSKVPMGPVASTGSSLDPS